MKQWVVAAAAGIVLRTLQLSPLWLAHPLSRFYVKLVDFLVPRLRATAYANLEVALPGADTNAVTDGVFQSIARLLVTFARFPSMNSCNIGNWIRYQGLENYWSAKARGCGVLIATGHIGNWELSAFAHALMTEPMHVVVRPLDNVRVDAAVEQHRRMSGNRVIQKKDAARQILKALRKNEAVGILIDQNVGLSEGVFVPFFGRLACAGTAFARLANRSGAAVIPGYAVWSHTEQKYILHFEREVEMTNNDEADTARIHSRLEAVIRQYPDQWLWIHRRWKTRPVDELLPS